MSETYRETDTELAQVFDTQQESEAQVVRSFLEANGIEAILANLDAPQDVLPGVGGMVVLVRSEQAEAARRIIAEQREAGPIAAEQAEAATELEAQREPRP